MTNEEPMQVEPLGSRIRRIRQELGFTQDELALRADVDQSGLSKFERLKQKRMGPVQLTHLARVLGMTLDELVTGTDYGEQ